VDRIEPAALPPLAEVRAPLARAWVQRENGRRLAALADQLAGRIRGGEDIAAVAASVNAPLVSRERLQANQETQTEIGGGVLRGLFGQAKGQVFTEAQAADRRVIGRVDEIRAAVPAEAAPLVEQIRPALTQQLVQDMVQSAAAAAAARVRAESDPARARSALGLDAEPAPAAP